MNIRNLILAAVAAFLALISIIWRPAVVKHINFADHSVCLRQGETKPISVTLTPSTSGPADAAFEIIPSNLATLSAGRITVASQGNSIDLKGDHVGSGTLKATAAGFEGDETNVRVIVPVAKPILKSPDNGATVVAGNVTLDWDDVPNAIGYIIYYREEPLLNFTFTNSQGSENGLNFVKDKKVHWKVQAKFDSCPNEAEFGPESEERTFSTVSP